MPAWNSVWKALEGGNFQDAFSYAFLDQETVDASNQADSTLESMIRNSSADGKITIDDMNLSLKRIQQNALPEMLQNPEMSPAMAFEQGWIEQAQKLQTSTAQGFKSAFNWTAGLIPWQIYVIVGIVIVVYVLSVIPKPK